MMDADILVKLKKFISSPHDGCLYFGQIKRNSYLLHIMDANILVKLKKFISSPHDGYRYFSNHKIMCQYALH